MFRSVAVGAGSIFRSLMERGCFGLGSRGQGLGDSGLLLAQMERARVVRRERGSEGSAEGGREGGRDSGLLLARCREGASCLWLGGGGEDWASV